MNRREMDFVSEMDSQKLSALTIAPNEPKAILQIAHGMCEHKERYIPFMEYMAERGYACIINDHRGHGKSVRSDQELGYLNFKGGEYLIEDMHLITLKAKSIFGDLPVVLLGHSMGALAARGYIKTYDDELKGLVLCGCPAKRSMSGIGMVLDKALQFGKGARARSSMVDKLFLSEYEKPFKSEKTQNAWLCSDKEVVKKYNDDPLCNYTFTLNGYEALIWLSGNAYSTSGIEMKNPDLPIHVIAGTDDVTVGSKDAFVEGVSSLRKAGYKTVTSYRYEEMRHEILNEIGKEQVYRDIFDFCDDATWVKNPNARSRSEIINYDY